MVTGVQTCALPISFFPLGAAFVQPNPVLSHQAVVDAAARLGCTPAQVALAWTLNVAPNVLVIPGTSKVRHLDENVAAAELELDDEDYHMLETANA